MGLNSLHGASWGRGGGGLRVPPLSSLRSSGGRGSAAKSVGSIGSCSVALAEGRAALSSGLCLCRLGCGPGLAAPLPCRVVEKLPAAALNVAGSGSQTHLEQPDSHSGC